MKLVTESIIETDPFSTGAEFGAHATKLNTESSANIDSFVTVEEIIENENLRNDDEFILNGGILQDKYAEVSGINKSLMSQLDALAKKNVKLIMIVHSRENELMESRTECLNAKKELEKIRKTIQMIQGSAQLDEIIKQGRPTGETFGLGFNNNGRKTLNLNKHPIFTQKSRPPVQNPRGHHQPIARDILEPSHRNMSRGDKLKNKVFIPSFVSIDFNGEPEERNERVCATQISV